MSDDGGIPSIADTDPDLPATLRVAGLALERTRSPPSLACWTGCFPESAGGNAAVVSPVAEPAAPPE
ncbi:hypothetical protein AB0I39_27475 [Kitasatospora purpeofusca]|uniref:hypothetical protein n=1 Tax=Kitasatospora purpeofusca TaxID=67352 RepID=UPI0033C3550E